MKERPILMSGPMVRAILDGSKTQTRRVMTPTPVFYDVVPEEILSRTAARVGEPGWWWSRKGGSGVHSQRTDADFKAILARSPELSPYGQPGDRLWVRETWYCDDYTAGDFDSDLCETPTPSREARIARWREETFYRADGDPEFEGDENSRFWKPSIHMPRWASRLSLEITGVRVERVQDITGDAVLAEGVEFPAANECTPDALLARWNPFRTLWDSLNASCGYGWDVNPWVWVVAFKKVTP